MELLYTPERLEDAELRASFVPRQPAMEQLAAILAEEHLLLVGGSGTGKTTLLLLLRQALPESLRAGVVFRDDLDRLLIDAPEHAALAGGSRIAAAVTCESESVRQFLAALGQPVRRLALAPFDAAQTEELLRRRAALEGRADFDDLLQRNRVRLEMLRPFLGGNPRVLLVLYRALTGSEPVQVRRALDYLLDALTPQYRARLDALAPQPRRILERLACEGGRTGRALTPTAVAHAASLPVNQGSVQLRRLEQAGHVRSCGAAGRHSYYALAEPLFALWIQARAGREGQRRIERLLDFLQRWHAHRQSSGQVAALGGRLRELASAGTPDLDDPAGRRRYLAAALGRAFRDSSLDRSSQVQMLQALLEARDWEELAAALDALEPRFAAVPRLAALRGLARARFGRWREALADYDRSLACAPDEEVALERIEVLLDLHQHHRALESCEALLRRAPDCRPAQLLRALAFAFTGRFDQAIGSAGPLGAESAAGGALLQALARLREIARQPGSLLRFLLAVGSFDEARVVWGQLLAKQANHAGMAALAAQALDADNRDFLSSILPPEPADDAFLCLRRALDCLPDRAGLERLSAEVRPVVEEILLASP